MPLRITIEGEGPVTLVTHEQEQGAPVEGLTKGQWIAVRVVAGVGAVAVVIVTAFLGFEYTPWG